MSAHNGDAPTEVEQAEQIEQSPRVDIAVDTAPPAGCSCTAESLPSPTGELAVLRVGGEVDLLTIPEVQAAVDYQLDRRPAHLLVDLARLQFCSARGMTLLADAGATAAERGIDYALSAVPPQLGRIWDQLWPGELPACYPSTAVAVTVIRGRHRPA